MRYANSTPPEEEKDRDYHVNSYKSVMPFTMNLEKELSRLVFYKEALVAEVLLDYISIYGVELITPSFEEPCLPSSCHSCNNCAPTTFAQPFAQQCGL